MIVEAVRRFFEVYAIEPCGIVAAVSGGADSTALLLALVALREEGFRITCAHVNHHLRDLESDGDEAFVRDLCARLQVPLTVANGSIGADAIRAHGIEAAARLLREQCLQDIRQADDARFIATAHQKNDQAETIVMRVFTGSGITGLRGIHPVRDDGFIRPLLDVTRTQIEAFLRDRAIEPRVDRMNTDPRYLRVRIRQTLRDYDAAVIDNLAAVAQQAREQWPLLERIVDETDRACTTVTDEATRFAQWPEDAWLRQALLHRHIRRLDPHSREVSSADLRRIVSELDSLKRMHVTKTLELVREDDAIVLRQIRQAKPAAEYDLTIAAGGEVFLQPIGAVLRIHPHQASDASAFCSPPSAFRKTQLIQLPPGAEPRFTVRNRRPGDRFQPLGLKSAKKLKDFLIDRKVPADERDLLPLVLWNDTIAWVAGVEVSDSFKITGEGDVYELRLEER